MHINHKGVTLIETIAVLIILLILAAAATIKMGAYDTIKLNAAAQKIADDIRYAQGLTMAGLGVNENGYPIALTIQFRTDIKEYKICRGYVYSNGTRLSYNEGNIINDPFTQEAMRVSFTSGDFKDITFGEINFGSQGVTGWYGLVFFDIMGSPFYNKWNGGWGAWLIGPLCLDSPSCSEASPGYITIQYKGKSKTIKISPEISRVWIQ